MTAHRKWAVSYRLKTPKYKYGNVALLNRELIFMTVLINKDRTEFPIVFEAFG